MSWDLIADIGGTNTRLARFQNSDIDAQTTLETGGAGSILSAISGFIQSIGTPPARVMIAIAGPVANGSGEITNGQDHIEVAAIQRAAKCTNAQIINDFEAAAWSLATVTQADVTPLQGPSKAPPGHRIILGAGTGLGVGSLVAAGDGFKALPGEGGHVSISPLDGFERDVFSQVARLWPEIAIHREGAILEAEGILSGTGLPILYQAVCHTKSLTNQPKTAGEIFQAANAGQSEALETVRLFTSHLARVAGNLAVSVTPRGGVFFAGGVLQQNPWILDEAFLAAFNAGGRFTAFRESFPIYIYDNPNVGLIGAANALTYG